MAWDLALKLGVCAMCYVLCVRGYSFVYMVDHSSYDFNYLLKHQQSNRFLTYYTFTFKDSPSHTRLSHQLLHTAIQLKMNAQRTTAVKGGSGSISTPANNINSTTAQNRRVCSLPHPLPFTAAQFTTLLLPLIARPLLQSNLTNFFINTGFSRRFTLLRSHQSKTLGQ